MKKLMTVMVMLAVTAGVVSAESTEEKLANLEKQIKELKAEGSSSQDAKDVSIGGYGELHYNNLSGSGGASDKDELDFHRFVVFFGYEFSDRIHFNSELEVEHSLSGDAKPGEVELEQAYIDIDINDSLAVRGGLFLLPIGIMNETHEPTTFYGVERNSVERNIIPSTWWEAGAGLRGDSVSGLSYSAYIHSGLKTSTNSGYAVRSGRQKAAKADASDLAGTLALSWSLPGVTVGGAVQYQSDVDQGDDPDAGEAWLGEIHIDYSRGPFDVRCLYAEWSLDGKGPESYGSDKQYGWYVEHAYKFVENAGVFFRVSEWDNTAGSAGTGSEKAQYVAGVNWWPHEQVVVKADYQWQENENDKNQDGFNLGLGYHF